MKVEMGVTEILVFLIVVFFGGLAIGGMQDKVLVDSQHHVICIEKNIGKLIGCMTDKGEPVSNSHWSHAKKYK